MLSPTTATPILQHPPSPDVPWSPAPRRQRVECCPTAVTAAVYGRQFHTLYCYESIPTSTNHTISPTCSYGYIVYCCHRLLAYTDLTILPPLSRQSLILLPTQPPLKVPHILPILDYHNQRSVTISSYTLSSSTSILKLDVTSKPGWNNLNMRIKTTLME